MARIIYENDLGEQTSFEFNKELVSALELQHDVDGLGEIFALVRNQIAENQQQAD